MTLKLLENFETQDFSILVYKNFEKRAKLGNPLSGILKHMLNTSTLHRDQLYQYSFKLENC